MNEIDKHFIKRYEELLEKGYCDCNEMNCIDNNSPRRILNIVNNLQSKIDKAIDKINQYELIVGYYDSNYDEYDDTYSHEIKDELLDILKDGK